MENQLPNRKHPRLKLYNYSQSGMYFITICTHNRKCILSKIIFQHIKNNVGADTGPAPTLSDIICSFKTRTTGQIIKQIKRGICKPFNKRFWQRNYYEHVIRNENELYEIQKYIQYNPLNWEKDKYNC